MNKWIGVGDFRSTPKIDAAVREVLDSGRISYGPRTRELEERWAVLHGCRYGIAVSSGTAALHVALLALAEEKGWVKGISEIIVPATTFVATFNTVIHAGFIPVPADIGYGDALLSPDEFESKITENTVAVIPVHLFGQASDMRRIGDIARLNYLSIIEDSAEAVLVGDNGRLVGSMGDFGCFSTYVAHHVPAGNGGMLTTNDEKLNDLARSIVNHGRDVSYFDPTMRSASMTDVLFSFERPGLNYRSNEVVSTIALELLRDIVETVARRRAIAHKYHSTFSLYDNAELYVTTEREFGTHSWMMYPILVSWCRDRAEKFFFMKWLYDHGIDSRECLPLINQPYIRALGFNEDDFPASAYWNRCGLYLPCHQYMTDDDVDQVISAVLSGIPMLK